MKKHFQGTIIITDPCYVIKAEHHGTKPDTNDDWEFCEYGGRMDKLGIKNFITRSTLYGDWSCTTFEKGTKKILGKFCADAGLVSVMLLSEVLKYNPDFNNWIKEHEHCATIIENFDGDVEIKVLEDEDGDYVEVHGEGNIRFIGKQTGL